MPRKVVKSTAKVTTKGIVKVESLHPPHPTERIALKTVDVDQEMVKVINWLNGYLDIFTQWCCQGEEDGQAPYVIFLCMSPVTLTVVLNRLTTYAETTVETYEGCLRYNTRFHSIHDLQRFSGEVATEVRTTR